MIRREPSEIIWDIKNDIPGFNRESLLEYTKWAIPRLYKSLKNGQETDVKCSIELISKLNKQKEEYKISDNIDNMAVQYVELYDNIKKDNEVYIQVYISIFFYDNTKNNVISESVDDKYWNDIWIVTYKESNVTTHRKFDCDNCGAIMKNNKVKDTLECEYCGNVIHNKCDSKWEIVDINVRNY